MDLARFNENPDFTIFSYRQESSVCIGAYDLLFLAFAFLLLPVKYIHKRSIVSLFSTNGKIDLRRFAWVLHYVWIVDSTELFYMLLPLTIIFFIARACHFLYY